LNIQFLIEKTIPFAMEKWRPTICSFSKLQKRNDSFCEVETNHFWRLFDKNETDFSAVHLLQYVYPQSLWINHGKGHAEEAEVVK